MSSLICFYCEGSAVGHYHCQSCPLPWQRCVGVFGGALVSGSLSLLFEGSKSSSCSGWCLVAQRKASCWYGRGSRASTLANHFQNRVQPTGYSPTHRSLSKIYQDRGERFRESTSNNFLGQLFIARGSLMQKTLIVQVIVRCRQLLYRSIE